MESVKPELMAALQREALAKYVGGLQEKAKLDLNPELIKQSPPETAPEAK